MSVARAPQKGTGPTGVGQVRGRALPAAPGGRLSVPVWAADALGHHEQGGCGRFFGATGAAKKRGFGTTFKAGRRAPPSPL